MGCSCGKKKLATQPSKQVVKAPVAKPKTGTGHTGSKRIIRRGFR